MRYTNKDLMKVSNTSIQSVNKLFKSNEELKELAKEHVERENRNVFYDEVIYEWFCRRYKKKEEDNLKSLVEDSVAGGISQNEDGESPEHSPAPYVRLNEAIKAELEELKGKYAELQVRFDEVEAERKQLLEQNGNLLLLLSQEKAEKQKLLPPPRKTIGERLKSLFHKPPSNAG